MSQHVIPFLKRNVYIDAYRMDNYAEKFRDICVVNHMGELYLKNGTVDDIRCPYFRLRGSPVTEEQAAFIIGHSRRCADWCHPDGTIGLDGTLGEYPTAADIMLEFAYILKIFSFIEMVVAITSLDWGPLEKRWNNHNAEWCNRNFNENIRVGHWLHDGTIEILEPAEAYDRICLYENRTRKPESFGIPLYNKEGFGVYPLSD